MSLLLTFGKKSVIQRAISVLRKYGTDAHAYIPGGSISTYGPELVTNGGFDTGLTGWTAGSIGTGSVTASGGVLTVQLAGGDAFANAHQEISVVSGKSYKLTGTVVSGTTGNAIIGISATNTGATISSAIGGGSTAGTYSAIWVAPSTATYYLQADITNADTVGKFSNISVKEVLTTTSVVLNGLTAGNYTDSARTAPGSKDQFVGGVTDALDGIHATQGAAGNKPVLRQGPVNLLLNSATLSTQSVAVAASPYTLSFTGTGTVTKSGTATGALVGTGATDRVTQTFTPTAGTLTLTVTGSVTSAQLQLGSTATTYIPTTSAKASAGTGPQYWEFGGDGTPTDYLSLGSVPFQMSDDHCVVLAASVNSIAAGSKPIFSNYGTTTRRVAQLSVEANTLTAKWTDDAGTAGTSPTGSVVAALTPFVATARKVGNVKELRKNGVLINSSSTAAGTTTLTNSAIGTDGAVYFPGSEYCTFAIKGTITDADLLLIEKLAANLAGVTL